MVHHQYATFDPAISSQEVWSVEISGRGFVLLVWSVDIDSVSFQDYVVKPIALDLDDWDLNTEVVSFLLTLYNSSISGEINFIEITQFAY